jgi:hypothetical protein
VRPDDDGAADRAALSRAEPVVTETMAELYLKQGHREDALRVYQALLAGRPDDSMLQRKVATLSGHGLTIGSGQSAGDFLRGVLHGQPAAPVAPSSTLAGAFAGAEVDEPTPGAPTRLADDTISLDALFGEAGPRASAVAAPGGGGGVDAPSVFHEERSPAGGVEGAGGGAVAGGFSFDEFFSSPTGGDGPGGAGGVGASGGAPAVGAGQPGQRNSGRQARPVADDEGDLDQFQAWLKKLKS